MVTKLFRKLKKYFFTKVDVTDPDEMVPSNTDEKIHFIVLKILIVLILGSLLLLLVYIYSNQGQNVSQASVKEDIVINSQISDREFLQRVSFGNLQDIISALDTGVNPNAKNETGRNAFLIGALSDANPALINILKSYGTKINDRDINGYNAAMISVLTGGKNSLNYVKGLIDAGINVNASTNSGISTLMVAVGTTNDVSVIETLIKAGANVNYRTKDNVTPLMIAAKITQNPKIIKLLLKNKANKKIKDKTGVSAYDNLLTNHYLGKNKELRKLLK